MSDSLPHMKKRMMAFASFAAMATVLVTPAAAEEAPADAAADAYGAESIIVTGRAATYNNSETTAPMLVQQAPLTSALSMIDNLPGVSIQEGDTFGFDDWSTAIVIRGFQTNLDTQQIGITIDGLPNGNSNYGGGAKANRYIDSMNIGSVAVSQGTSDIASLSNEALGGTIDFRTDDPQDERRMRFSATLGQFDAQRFYARYDTGRIFGDQVKAWISGSYQEATDWAPDRSAQNNRTHFAGKFVTTGAVKVSGYMSYDDTLENNYDQIYSDPGKNIPDTDFLIGNWTGVPYVDQSYRQVWGTLRENFFTYLKAEGEVADGIELKGAAYYHRNTGRGDWAPPYMVDVAADGAGNPESELDPTQTVNGGPFLGQIFFVDANGVALSPTPGCQSTLTFPYGGTSNAAYDPACYPATAIPVQSYRHTHYEKSRVGLTGEGTWTASLAGGENRLRAGLWYEDTTRKEHRDWHKLVDARVGPDYEALPYWTQYNRKYPQSTFKWYVEDQFQYGPVTASIGIKQFRADIERNDLFGDSADAKLKSTSKVLFSGGLQVEMMRGLTAFAGYAENYKALTDDVLETAGADYSNLKPETSRNIEGGVRFQNGNFQGSATYFNNRFKNRILFLSNTSTNGPDYLEGTNGNWFNAGGINSDGFELVANYHVMPELAIYGSYTHINAEYRGTGLPDLDTEIGIVPGNTVAGIPENMFVLSADWKSGPFLAGVSGKYTGKRYVNRANDWRSDSYFLTDIYVGVNGEAISDTLESLQFRLVANNVTDESYLGGISGDYAWIGAPRTITFTLTADF